AGRTGRTPPPGPPPTPPPATPTNGWKSWTLPPELAARAHQSFPGTSPPSREPRARQVPRLMALGTKRTEPSHSATFTPLVWPLFAVVAIRPLGYMHDRVLGGPTWK